jgi:mono/diheme cytochrome c family protein
MKWVKRILLALLALVLLTVGVIYAWGAIIINSRYEPEPRTVLTSSRPDITSRGERLASVFGCRGCHQKDMEGGVFIDAWYIGRIIAPNLTRAVDQMSDTELEAVIRQGVRPDGRSVFGMPSGSFAAMTDRDLSAILSFIANYPKQDQDLGHSRYGLMARTLFILGKIRPEASHGDHSPWQSGFEQDPLKHGEYIAINACAECHGSDLEGQGDFTPSLAVARAYSLDDFKLLMSDGTGLGGRDLGLMTRMGQFRFSHMNEDEVEALYQYLQSR